MFVNRRISSMNKILVIELVGLILFLLYTNPTRVELDNKLLKSLNTNFVKGAAQYLRASFNGIFTNCLLYSHLYIGTKGHYFGIGGLWIDPHYWSSVSGVTVIIFASLSAAKTIILMQTNDTVRCCFSILLFILFSESVESKLGPVRMTAFIATCGCAAFVAVKIVSPRSIIPRDIPLQFIAGACASAFLCYLARSANSSNLFFTMNDVTIPKTFLWRGLQVDYSQATIANVMYQLASSDFIGLSGTLVGAFFQDVLDFTLD